MRAYLIVVVVALMAGCASRQQQGDAIRMEWTPTRAQWEAVRTTGTHLNRRDGSSRMFLTPALVDNLLAVTTRLEIASGLNVELAIVETTLPNAFAKSWKGRDYVALSTSYLDRFGNDVDALADTLGHEMAHLKLGHSGEARQERDSTAAGIGTALGTAANFVIPFSGYLFSAASTGIARGFTRDEEREADELGLKWSSGAGYDPCAKVRVVAILAKLRGEPSAWLSTHPTYAERAERANELSKQRTGKDCPTA